MLSKKKEIGLHLNCKPFTSTWKVAIFSELSQQKQLNNDLVFTLAAFFETSILVACCLLDIEVYKYLFI